jgi:putative transposase
MDAVLYMEKTGCQWRQLPHDFPKWSAVKSFYYRAVASGLWERLRKLLVEKGRMDAGRNPEPTYAIIDSQRTKTMYNAKGRGIDGEKKKKTKGRKRHIATDTMGHLLAIVVHASNIHDTVGGKTVYDSTLKAYPSIEGFCADMGYRGDLCRVGCVKRLAV